MSSRRAFVRSVFGLGAGSFAASQAFSQHKDRAGRRSSHGETGHRQHGSTPVMVETPDVPNLPYTLENGVKVFHLVAEPVKRKIVPYRTMDVWGYNGTCPGPTIQVVQGDRVRIVLDNHLPESTTMHWHGFEIPVQMDGMPYISQKPVPPGGRFTYGMFVMHPRTSYASPVDHDSGIIPQE